MSDRDAIIDVLGKARSRIVRNRLVDRAAAALARFVLAGVAFELVGVFVLLDPVVGRVFWTVWLAALAVVIVRAVRSRGDLRATASDLDRKARLDDEVLSAWWFAQQEASTPWIDLQIRRAAARLRRLDVRGLYPAAVPRSSWVAAGGVVLLAALSIVPPPFTPTLLFSTPAPDLEALNRQAQLDAIDALLEQADRLAPDPAIAEFQRLVENMRDENVPLEQTADQARQAESLLDEGNLDIDNLLEGLDRMGQDLQSAEETTAAGEALSEGDLPVGAEEFQRLAEELEGGAPASEALEAALDAASRDARAGLEELAAALEAAAEALAEDNAAAASESLMDAAESLGELSDRVESQRLQNEAAQQMDALREALRQQESQQDSGEAGLNGENPPGEGESGTESEAGAGDAAAGAPQEGQTGMPGAGQQPASGQGSSQLVPGEAPEGAESGLPPSAISGDLQNIEPTGTGDTPTGIGFSPEQKTGAPTSLEVQLQLLATFADSNPESDAPEEQPEPEATRREQSSLDYRDVPSELTPAQQELLNRERIPREYQNVIRDYFRAIRPQPDSD